MGPWVALACLWITGTSVDGHDKEWGIGADPCQGQHGPVVCLQDQRDHEQRATMSLGPAPGDERPVSERSDYAALLVYRGRAQEAIALLEAVEQQHPGEYTVAANLGTAYELAGNDAEALRWIREGIRRNPASHDGTEWLHVKILEAKLALAEDPTWLETHSVLGLDFGDDAIPMMPVEWPEGQDRQTTRKALTYQLRERMGFVKPPDPIVADLLADLGSLVAHEDIVEHAIPILRLAVGYKSARDDVVRRRHDALVDLVEKRRFRNTLQRWAIIAGVVALVALLVALVVRRRRRLRRETAVAVSRSS